MVTDPENSSSRVVRGGRAAVGSGVMRRRRWLTTKDTGKQVLLTSLSRGHITSGSVPDPRQSSDERDESVRCVCEKPISGGLRKGVGWAFKLETLLCGVPA